MATDTWQTVVTESVMIVTLLLLLLAAGWWWISCAEVYRNRKLGMSYRRWLIEHSRIILEDTEASCSEKGIAATWLALVYEPATLSAFAEPYTDGSGKTVTSGKYSNVIYQGLRHLSVLAMLENRRVGTAITTLANSKVGEDGAPIIPRAWARIVHGEPRRRRAEDDDKRLQLTLDTIENLPLAKDAQEKISHRALDTAGV
jgi:hypothetical protein